jgi:predicted RND superfamily exporter protein
MGLTGVPLGIWNQSVPTLVIIVAAGHSAQMLKRWVEEVDAGRDGERAVVETLVHVGPVMLAAGGTATLGFAALSLLHVPGMADLGLAAAYGIGSAVILELTFVPALRARLRLSRRPGQRRVRPAGGATWLADCVRSARGRYVLLGAAALVLAWWAVGVPRLRTGGSPRDYLPAADRATVDLDAIRAHFPGTVTMAIQLSGPPGSMTLPQTLVAIDRLAQALAADPNVVRTSSLVDLVRELHAALTPERTRVLPSDPALLAQLLFLGRGPAFERVVDRGDTRSVLWAYLRSDDTDEVRRVLTVAREAAAGLALPDGVQIALAGGSGPMLLALEDRVTRGKVINIAVLLLVIFALSALVLRSAVAGAFVLIPLCLSVAVTTGILAWAGIHFDLVSASIVAIGVGIGADYAIYVLYRLREEQQRGATHDVALERTLATSGRAVLGVGVAIALGFAVFVPSAYRAFSLTGLLTPAGMLASCVAAVTVMPAALFALRPAFLFDRPG